MTAPYSLNPTSYQGIKEKNPPNLFFFNRAPTAQDVKLFDLGDIWINQDNTPSPAVFMLVEKEMGIAVWNQFTSGIGSDVDQLSADGSIAVLPTAGNINIFGGVGISTTGASPTMTLSIEGTVANSYPTDAGTAAPMGNILNILGDGTTIATAAAGNTVTISALSTPSFTWTVDTTSPIAVLADEGHISTTVPITYTLPAACAVGDEIAFVGGDANIFTVQAGAGQTIQVGNQASMVGGTVSSTLIGDTLMLLCTVANTQFIAIARDGNYNFT